MQIYSSSYAPGADALPGMTRGMLITVVLLMHALAIWALLQLTIEPAGNQSRAPVQVTWVIDRQIEAPPAPAVVQPVQRTPVMPAKQPRVEPERVIAAKKPVTQAERFTTATPVEKDTPKPVQQAPVAAPNTAQPAAAPAGGGQGTSSQPKSIGISSVQFKNRPSPVYPDISKELGEQGLVTIRTVIGTDGRVQSAQVGKSSGHNRLDSAALRAVQRASFYPYRENGVAMAAVVNIPFNFNFKKPASRARPEQADKQDTQPEPRSAPGTDEA